MNTGSSRGISKRLARAVAGCLAPTSYLQQYVPSHSADSEAAEEVPTPNDKVKKPTSSVAVVNVRNSNRCIVLFIVLFVV